MRSVLALRSVSPDAAPVARGLAVVAVAALIALQWGPPGSATAVAATAAIAGAAALQDGPRGRVLRVAAVSVLMGLAVVLGALTSAYSPAFIAATAVWCFATAMPWALGPRAGPIATASSALLVVTAPVGPTWSSAPAVAVLAVCAGLCQAVLIAVRPPRRWRMQRDALVAVYRSLAADAAALAGGGTAPSRAEPMIALRAAFTGTPGQATRHPARYRNRYLLPERIATSLTDIAGTAGATAVLAAAAEALTAVADTDRTGREAADAALRRLDAVVAELPEDAGAQRLSAHLHEAAAMWLADFVPSWPDALRVRRPELRSTVRAWANGMRGQLATHSPVFRHAVRLGAAVAAACVIDSYTAIGDGAWIALTVLMVLRPETAHTYTRCFGRLAATAVGAVVAGTVLLVGAPGPVSTAALAVVFIGLVYIVSGLGYLAHTAALAAAVVLLIGIDRGAGAAGLGDLLLATLVGGVLAVLAHVMFPDDALMRLAQRAGELLKTEIDYAVTVVRVYLHELDGAVDVRNAAWQRAFRARAAFEAAAGATRLNSRELRHWMRSYRTVLNAITSSCATLEHNLPIALPPDSHRCFVLAVDEYLEVLSGEPPTPVTPWTVDTVELATAEQRVRRAAPVHESDDGWARLLVTEIAAITRHLTAIAVSPWPTAAR